MREAYRRLPALQRLSRAFIYSLVELLLAPGMTRDPRYLKPAEVDRDSSSSAGRSRTRTCDGD